MTLFTCKLLDEITMKYTIPIVLLMLIFTLGVTEAMAVEEAKYSVLKKNDRFEIRDYAPHVLAEIIVEGDIEQAGDKIEMTAPVSQEPRGEKIKMTAPVSLQPAQGRWAVSFMMPSSYTLETLPEPEDPGIILRQVPARRMAVVRYSGFWSKKNYLRYKNKLEEWINKEGLTILGDPIWARYNPPFTPWFLRRNEILIPVNSVSENEQHLEQP